MDTIASRHDEDVLEAVERFDEAREKLEKVREERKAYWRTVNEKLSPPAATPLQSAVQTAADWTQTAATISTTVMTAALIATGTLSPVGGVVVAHSIFDNIGGYEWLKDWSVDQFGLEQQTARTMVAGVKTIAYAASIYAGLSKAVSATSGAWNALKGAFGASAETSVFNRAYDALTVVSAGAGSIWSQALKVSGAIGGAIGFVYQQEQLKAHHETSKGQSNQARALEIDQDVKDAQEGVSGLAKRIKALRSEEGALDRGYKTMADALDISIGGG